MWIKKKKISYTVLDVPNYTQNMYMQTEYLKSNKCLGIVWLLWLHLAIEDEQLKQHDFHLGTYLGKAS